MRALPPQVLRGYLFSFLALNNATRYPKASPKDCRDKDCTVKRAGFVDGIMAGSFVIQQIKNDCGVTCERGRDRMAAHRKSDQHRDDLCAGELRKAVSDPSRCVGGVG